MGKDAWCVDMAKQAGLAWANRRSVGPVHQQEAGTEASAIQTARVWRRYGRSA